MHYRPLTLLCLGAAAALCGCVSLNPADMAAQQMSQSAIASSAFSNIPLGAPSSSSSTTSLAANASAFGAAVQAPPPPTCTAPAPAAADLIIGPAGRTHRPTLFDLKAADRAIAPPHAVADLAGAHPAPDFQDPKTVQAAYTGVLSDLGPAGSLGFSKAIVKSFLVAAHPDAAENVEKTIGKQVIKSSDARAFADVMSGTAKQPIANVTPAFSKVLLAYYSAYFDKGFVDRHGSNIGTPSFNTGIPDADIRAMTQIFIEAAADYIFQDPIPTDVMYPVATPAVFYGVSSSALPTALQSYAPDGQTPVYVIKTVATVAVGCQGLSFGEAKAVGYLGHLGGHLAVLNTGVLFDSLNSIHIGFVVAGNFSVGSNNTLSAVVKTAMQTTVQRAVEHYLAEQMLDMSPAEAAKLQTAIAQLPGYGTLPQPAKKN